MATYDSLTQEEKDSIAIIDEYARGTMVSALQLHRIAETELHEQLWIDVVQPILLTLDPGEVVPQSTGHAGASSLTPLELNSIVSWLFGMNDAMDGQLQMIRKAIGVNQVE